MGVPNGRRTWLGENDYVARQIFQLAGNYTPCYPILVVLAHPSLLDTSYYSSFLVIMGRDLLLNNKSMCHRRIMVVCMKLFPVAASKVWADRCKILCCGKPSLVTSDIPSIVLVSPHDIVCRDFEITPKMQFCKLNIF